MAYSRRVFACLPAGTRSVTPDASDGNLPRAALHDLDSGAEREGDRGAARHGHRDRGGVGALGERRAPGCSWCGVERRRRRCRRAAPSAANFSAGSTCIGSSRAALVWSTFFRSTAIEVIFEVFKHVLHSGTATGGALVAVLLTVISCLLTAFDVPKH